MDIRSDVVAGDRQHAADPAEKGLRAHRLHHSGQGRVHESGPVGEGPRGALHHQGRHRLGTAPGRRHHRGRHRRQYRHRPCHGGRRHGLSHRHRHPRDPVAGKEGHPAPDGGRAGAGAGGALQEPQQLREIFRPPGRAPGGRIAGRGHLGQPVRQRGQPARPYRDDGPGDLATDRRECRRLHLRGGLGRHAGRGERCAESQESRRSRSALPIPWGRRSTATTPPAN